MSSIRERNSRRLRDEGDEKIVNLPIALIDELDLEAGDERAFREGEENGIQVVPPEHASCYAPTRRIRDKTGEFVINVPAIIVDDRNLVAGANLTWSEPKDNGTVTLKQ